jgi:parallel beta-helix repeat protein
VDVNVHLKDCRGVTVVGNTFWAGFAHDLLIEESTNVVVGPNNLDRNPRYNAEDRGRANHGVVVRSCTDCTITGLHVNGVRHAPAGVRIENCRRLNLSNCTILDCDNVGLLVKDVSDSRISGCLIRDDRPGGDGPMSLRLTGGRGNLVVGNLLGGRHEIDAAAAHAEGNHRGR